MQFSSASLKASSCCHQLISGGAEGDGPYRARTWNSFPRFPQRLASSFFFGVSAEVAVKAWNQMEELDLLPPSSQFQHYLWALAFMRT